MASEHCVNCVVIIFLIIGFIQVAVSSSSDPQLDALLKVFLSPSSSVNQSAKVSSETCDGKCYPEIGCTHGVANCLSVSCSDPEPLENIDTKFLFFSKNNQYDPYIVNFTLSEDELKNVPFNPNFFTVVLVHGYDDKYTENTSLGPIKNLYLNKMNDANIIAVDWSKGASNPSYQTGKANALVVGAQIALLMEKLDKVFGINLGQTLFIGFSLGGQVV
ncbi:lipase-like protein 1, partial [Leptotrombidium deliense]